MEPGRSPTHLALSLPIPPRPSTPSFYSPRSEMRPNEQPACALPLLLFAERQLGPAFFSHWDTGPTGQRLPLLPRFVTEKDLAQAESILEKPWFCYLFPQPRHLGYLACTYFSHLREVKQPLLLQPPSRDLAETKPKPLPSRAFPSPLWSKQNPRVSSREAPLHFGVPGFVFGGRQRKFLNSGEVLQWRHRVGALLLRAGRPFSPCSDPSRPIEIQCLRLEENGSLRSLLKSPWTSPGIDPRSLAVSAKCVSLFWKRIFVRVKTKYIFCYL